MQEKFCTPAYIVGLTTIGELVILFVAAEGKGTRRERSVSESRGRYDSGSNHSG